MTSMEERLRSIEDRLEIYNVIATHPLTGDTGERAIVDAFYADDVVVDRGNGDEPHDRDAMAEVLGRAEHRAAIAAGLAHFGNLPLVDLEGDTATAISYIALLTPDTDGHIRHLANHGDSRGYRVHRVGVNVWSLKRTGAGWRVAARTVRMVGDGAHELLSEAGRRHLARE
ncbi:nuclear transport factor 2 family protein [Mycolicibacterium sp. 018/SC-01/001]|uniref:nuclear transport factor 2 family protein n=1 Tax=Mycolicibacterium sp. 018/SC-01/001 TaxID=2592069 RepID=UPI00117D1F7D|nr:nuclear transport factor 2 family protein [Mycolicibacterium sp. 018/SC-01/001]TRW89111.1 nuclear transport factor 2 family protein [Mycolicibacterium sp. 018/SC-01/001]